VLERALRLASGAALALAAAMLPAAAHAQAGASDPSRGPGETVSWLRFAQASGPPETPPGARPSELAAPPLADSVTSVRLSDIAGRRSVQVDQTLRVMRNQPRLEEADVRMSVARALGNSYDLAGARARSLAQRYQIDVATGALRSRLDLRVAGGLENSSPSARIDPATGAPMSSSTHGRDDSALILRQPVYDLGARRERDRQSALFDSSESGVAATRDQVVVDTASAHLDVLQFSLASEFAREYLDELEKLFRQVNARVEAGGASPAESERVKARAIGARSSAIESSGSLESALLTYRRLVGAVPVTIPADDVLAPSALPSLDEALARATQRNPTLASLRANHRAIEAEVAAARSRLQPRLEVEVGNYRLRGASGADTSTNESRAMLVMSWNLLAGGADIAARNAALARLEDNRYRILDAERRIEEALRVSYNTLDAVERRAQSVREEFVANRRVVDAFRAQLVSGNRPLLDVLDAEQRLYQSRVEMLRLTVLQATLTLQALRQIGLIEGADAAGLAPDAPTDPADPRRMPGAAPLPDAPAPPAVLPALPQNAPAAPTAPTAPATPPAPATPTAPAAPAAPAGPGTSGSSAAPGPSDPPAAGQDADPSPAAVSPREVAAAPATSRLDLSAATRGALPGVRTPGATEPAPVVARTAGTDPQARPGAGDSQATVLDSLRGVLAALGRLLRNPAPSHANAVPPVAGA
jgi:adhesin transport system outer membrane protein